MGISWTVTRDGRIETRAHDPVEQCADQVRVLPPVAEPGDDELVAQVPQNVRAPGGRHLRASTTIRVSIVRLAWRPVEHWREEQRPGEPCARLVS
ncbi:hypothetical protein [Kocuria nitroreducens]|uniref:hypothetical protein n=1 Tax=Kocuria nitroreducens TaxID=3058914 RepID=UPI0036DD45D3